jgi:hypothetical protein
MTPQQRRGQIYLAACIGSLVILDLVLKAMLLAGGTLRPTQIVGTAITLVTCWFLWRGSKFAHGFMIFCTVLTVVFVLMFPSPFGRTGFAITLLLVFAFLLGLLAPATRDFIRYRRARDD